MAAGFPLCGRLRRDRAGSLALPWGQRRVGKLLPAARVGVISRVTLSGSRTVGTSAVSVRVSDRCVGL